MSLVGFAFGVLLCFLRTPPGAKSGDPPPEVQAPAPESAATESAREALAEPTADAIGRRLDATHDLLYTKVQRIIAQTDQRFSAPNRDLLIIPASPFRLGLGLDYLNRPGDAHLAIDAPLEITLRLPNIERRLRLFITSEAIGETPSSITPDNSLRTGIRTSVLKDVNFELGARVSWHPSAYASLGWCRRVPLGGWEVYPLAKLFAETKLGVGASSAVAFDRWSGQNLFRSSSYAQWREQLHGTEWTQVFIVAHVTQLLQPDRYPMRITGEDLASGFGARLLAGGATTRATDYYETGIFLKRPLRGHWLFGSILALVRWERVHDWKPELGIHVGFDALFWDLAHPSDHSALPSPGR